MLVLVPNDNSAARQLSRYSRHCSTQNSSKYRRKPQNGNINYKIWANNMRGLMEVQGQYYIGLLLTESQSFVDAQLLKQIQITHGNANAAYGRRAAARIRGQSTAAAVALYRYYMGRAQLYFSFTSGGQIKTEQDIRSPPPHII